MKTFYTGLIGEDIQRSFTIPRNVLLCTDINHGI